MPNFKDILQKLSVFKNNIPLLMSVILILIAVILLIPSHLMSAKLKSEIQKNSVNVGKKVDTELKSALSSRTWVAEQAYQEEHAKDANEIALKARQTTMRELLSYDIFLDPNNISSTVIFREFGQHYRKAIDELLIRVKAGDCPTEAEIKQGIEDSAVNSRLRRGRGMMGGMMGRSPGMGGAMGPSSSMRGRSGAMGRGGGYGGAYGGAYGGGSARGGSGAASRGTLSRSIMMGELEGMVIDEICRERAKALSVYAYPSDLSGYDFWADYKLAVEPNQAIEDCWYFQLAFWIIEDIFDTISSVNSDYDSVLTAPVKQVRQMSFTMGLKRPGAGGGIFTGRRRRSSTTKKDDVDKPMYIHSNDDGLSESCTGRFTTPDGDLDVIQFNIAVVVDVKAIMPFLKELCSAKEHKFRGFSGNEPEQTLKHNQITILESKFRSAEDEPYSLYDYGDAPVVELDLICEYIFNNKGYEEIKPKTVKEAIIAAAQPDTGR
ncbi:MAG: hypothetical protein ACYS17_04325 [Planctomycetota bacterium]